MPQKSSFPQKLYTLVLDNQIFVGKPTGITTKHGVGWRQHTTGYVVTLVMHNRVRVLGATVGVKVFESRTRLFVLPAIHSIQDVDSFSILTAYGVSVTFTNSNG